jgi:carbonyl reductase 1
LEELNNQGFKPQYHQLDIDDEASVLRLRDFLMKTYGGLDVLVNNAAISIPWTGGSVELFGEHASKTLSTNFFNTLRICNILFPILRPHARVVNLSSMLGHLSRISGQDAAAVKLRDTLSSSSLSVDELVQIMHGYVE